MMTEGLLPALRKLVACGYFGLEVEGTEHVPRSGPAVYVANHAGWFTMDTLLGAVVIADRIGCDRLPWGAVHDRVLNAPRIGGFFEALGGFPASWLRQSARIPAEMEVFSIYPEGVDGNCKSFWHAYQMRPWRTGFVRLAIARNAPVVPVAIMGGEESLPVLAPIRAFERQLGSVLPLPVVPVPLPAKWKFVFHPPVHVEASEAQQAVSGQPSGRALLQTIARDVAKIVQDTLDRETRNKPLVRLTRLIDRS